MTSKEAMVRDVLRCPAVDSAAVLAARWGIVAGHVANIRAGRRLAHVAPELARHGGRWPTDGQVPPPTGEALVRLVLETMRDLSAKDAAAAIGVDPRLVRRIRVGQRWPGVLPELPRSRPRPIGRPTATYLDGAGHGREALVRDACVWPPEDTTAAIARRHGVSRAYVCLVRQGKALRTVLPELPRVTAAGRVIPCQGCEFGVAGGCQLGVPEAGTVDAIGCATYQPLGSGSRPRPDERAANPAGDPAGSQPWRHETVPQPRRDRLDRASASGNTIGVGAAEPRRRGGAERQVAHGRDGRRIG